MPIDASQPSPAVAHEAGSVVVLDRDDLQPLECRTPCGSAWVVSVRGPGKRQNEDGVLVQALGDDVVVLAVADGMGGLPGGELATKLTLEALALRLAEPDALSEPRRAIVAGFAHANEAVLGAVAGGGATLVVALVRRGRLQVVHAGDAEALLVGQRGRLKLRTIAHSPTGIALDAGLIGEREAMVHEERHIVSNAIGMDSLTIEVGPEVRLGARDTLVLASDGLFDNLTQSEVTEAVRMGPLAAAAARATAAARRRMDGGGDDTGLGKPDDLSFVLFRPGSPAGR